MKLRLLIATFGVLLLSISGEAKSQQDLVDGYKVSICNVCDTNALFLAYAETLDEGNQLIVNLETFEARSYTIVIGPSKDGSGGVSKRIGSVPLPTEMLDILSVLEIIGAVFDARLDYISNGSYSGASTSLTSMETSNFFVLSSGFTGNGCGSPSHPPTYIGAQLVSYPFDDACNNHDVCYHEGTESKSDCDTQFFIDMIEAANNADYPAYYLIPVPAMRLLLGQYLGKKIAHQKARAGYYLVSNLELATNAYCSNKDSSYAECNSSGGAATGGSYVNTNSEMVSAGGAVYQQTCELWQFPNGFGGYYYLERNCTMNQIG